MDRITPNLWFDSQAEEAARFYTSIFKHSKIGTITRYGPAGAAVSGRPQGSVMTVDFEIFGQPFVALNGGPQFKFTEAVSFVVNCKTQDEIDTYSSKLTQGGEQGPCGWLKDKYGLSWQIVPTELREMLADADPEKRERVMAAMLEMKKLDLETLQRAYRGERGGRPVPAR